MTHDIEVLRNWIRVVLIIAAICSTSVPLIYVFVSRWHKTSLGRLFMLQALSFACAMDLSALFSVWMPNDILVLFWVDTLALTAIAASTVSLAWFIGKTNVSNRKARQNAAEQ